MTEISVDNCIAGSLCFFLLLATTYLFVKWIKMCNSLPPGPMPFPLIGTMLQTMRRDFRDVCKEYRKTYGDIFTLHIFNTPVIVVNGFETLKEVFVDNGDAFSERHPFDLVDEGLGGKGIGLSNGAIWKRNRRFAVRTLRDFGMGKKRLEIQIHKEIGYFLDALEEEKGQPFDIEHLISASVSNVMCLLLFGQRFSCTDDDFIKTLDMMRDLFEFNYMMTPGWSRYLPGDPFRTRRSLGQLKHLSDFNQKKIREHYEDFDENDTRDLIDAYIKHSKADVSTAESDETSRLDGEYNKGIRTTSRGVYLLQHPGPNFDKRPPFYIQTLEGEGPRMCPGESIARMELSLYFTAMLQRFRLCQPEGEDPPSFSTTFGNTCPPFPFKMRAVKRM